MAIVIAIGTTHRIAIGNNGASIGAAHCRHWRQILHSPNLMTLLPKIAAAVKKVNDKEDRSKNVAIYGMQEASGKDISERVEELLTEIDKKPRIQARIAAE